MLAEFKNAHEAYHSQIKFQREREESEKYYDSLLELASELEREISSWLTQPDAQRLLTGQRTQIRPDDSISNAGSRSSLRTRSAVSSAKSSVSAKARSAARKAALEARAATLQSLHQLQIEELKLQQRKATIELQAEIAEAEAERKVYELAEVDEPGKSVLHRNETRHDGQPAHYLQKVKVASTPRDKLPQDSREPKNLPINPDSPELQNAASPDRQISFQGGSFHDESLHRHLESQDRQNHARAAATTRSDVSYTTPTGHAGL